MIKFSPTVSEPGNESAFSGIKTTARTIARADAASGLWGTRSQVRRGNARLVRKGVGLYWLVGLNTYHLYTRAASNA